MNLEELASSSYFEISVTLIVGILAIKIIGLLFKKILKNKNQIHVKFLKSCAQGLVVIYVIYRIGLGIEPLKDFTTTIVTSSSLLVVVAGFAAQEALSNIINGLFISVFKPFEIGDRINLSNNNIAGYIEDITIRHTVIKTFNNSRVIVPNSVMNKEILENSHYKDVTAGNPLDINVSYDSDIDKAIEVMQDTIASHPDVKDLRTAEDIDLGIPKVRVFVRELGLNGVQLRATVWTETVDINFRTCSDLRRMIKKAFDENNITIPCQHVHVVGNVGIKEIKSSTESKEGRP